jgi:glycosyltransferase involved in cell wall biosynthesis
MDKLPVSVLIPVRNEEQNLHRCLQAIEWADELVVVDSQSTDRTVEIAKSFGAVVIQFQYAGGWPKKRQWALDTFPFRNEWVLLLDADEIILVTLRHEIANAIRSTQVNGYYVRLQIYFLGRQLKYGGTQFWKLCLFRRGKGRFERRLEAHDHSMGDMEVHEHVIVDGLVERLTEPIRHENLNSLDRYIAKHNEYSNWEARMLLDGGGQGGLPPSLFGAQAQRRRWLKARLYQIPGVSVLIFVYRYLFRLGFLDGVPGLIYCGLHAIQMFHAKAKIYERRLQHVRPD